MGKKLIVKGADFFQNGIIVGELVFYNPYTDANMQGESFSSSNTFYMLPAEVAAQGLTGKTVKYIRLYAQQAGSITLSWYSGSGSSTTGSTTIEVHKGFNTIELATEHTISTTNLPAVAGNGILSYWQGEPTADKGWMMGRVGGTTYTSRIPISFGNIEEPSE